jgi:2-polyprenyl-6-methoxyphenol hydroxylase-like FAD-dependent oxidoreductase
MDRYDIVVVGGGIAGSALASALAPAGLSVLVLERQTHYRDKVRGEYMHPWGLAEAMTLGLDDTLFAAGGGITPAIVGYDEAVAPADAEAAPVPLFKMVPGVPGGLCVGHPQASEALNSLAATNGAVVVRGVGDVEVTAGSAPMVRYEMDGNWCDAACRLVVAADGRQSTVRRALGVELHQVASRATLGGMLVRAEGWTSDSSFVAIEGDRYVLAFPRPGDLVRLYLTREPGEATSGPDRAQAMLDAFRLDCVPGSDALAESTPVGPCSYFQGTDAWTDEPFADGVVFIGDAAGWSDPILGEGLSVAMRDARSVRDVLLASEDWSTDAFRPYGVERAERMRRLRIIAHTTTELRCTFTPQGRARRAAFRDQMMADPLFLSFMLAQAAGPEVAPPETFDQENIDRILAYSAVS